jgi:hypothetical protein
MRNTGKYFLLLYILATPLFALTADDLQVKINGTIQSWASYEQNAQDSTQIGFGIRRLRLRVKSTFGQKISAFAQVEMTSPKLLDARISYRIIPQLQFRVGRFIGAGMRGAGLTLHSALDIIERPVSAQEWGRRTVGADYRDYGLELVATVSDFSIRAWIHNGDGSKNIKSSQTGRTFLKNGHFAQDAMLTYQPQYIPALEIGAHAGMGNDQFKYFDGISYINRDNFHYSAYLYYQPENLRFKTEYVSVTSQKDDVQSRDITFSGFYTFVGYQLIKNLELVGRYETVNYDHLLNMRENFYTLGATYFFFPEEKVSAKIALAYVHHTDQYYNNSDLLYAMFQFLF